MTNKFSIIIPVYNVTRQENICFFDELLSSIAKNLQTDYVADRFCELIIINDNPNEDVSVVINSRISKYNLRNVRIVYNDKNQGQAYSRNLGASIAQGDLLHFIDQDDFVQDDFYEKALLFLEKNNAEILLTQTVFKISNRNCFFSPYRNFTLKLYNNSYNVKDMRVLLCSNIAFSPGQYMIKKDVFVNVGQFSDLKNKGTDDWGFWMKLLYLAPQTRILFCSDVCFYYRIHTGQGIRVLNMKASLKEQFISLDHTIVNKDMFYFIVKFLKLNRIGRLLNAFLYQFVFYKRVQL